MTLWASITQADGSASTDGQSRIPGTSAAHPPAIAGRRRSPPQRGGERPQCGRGHRVPRREHPFWRREPSAMRSRPRGHHPRRHPARLDPQSRGAGLRTCPGGRTTFAARQANLARTLNGPGRGHHELLQLLVFDTEAFGHRLHRLLSPVQQQPSQLEGALGTLIPPDQRGEHLQPDAHRSKFPSPHTTSELPNRSRDSS